MASHQNRTPEEIAQDKTRNAAKDLLFVKKIGNFPNAQNAYGKIKSAFDDKNNDFSKAAGQNNLIKFFCGDELINFFASQDAKSFKLLEIYLKGGKGRNLSLIETFPPSMSQGRAKPEAKSPR